MSIWTITLFAIDLLMMGGILYILLMKRKSAHVAAGPETAGYREILEDLTAELEGVRQKSVELERSRAEYEKYERRLAERAEKVDELVSRAEKYVARVREASSSDTEDVYDRAERLARIGSDPAEVSRSLGINLGEAELINSLKGFKTT